jgi:hypothetical protein
MKTLVRLVLVLLVIAAIAFGVWYFVLNRPVDLQARPPGSDGALAWAYGLALTPARAALAPDALLVEAEASDMMPDGRLAANRGEWRLAFSSFTANGRVLITVSFQGTVTTGTSSARVHHAWARRRVPGRSDLQRPWGMGPLEHERSSIRCNASTTASPARMSGKSPSRQQHE